MKILRLVLLAAVAPICLLQGCDDTSNEPLPNSGQTLCINIYETCIDPVFQNATTTTQTCSQAGCHNLPGGSPSGGFGLNPGAGIGSPEMLVNFTSVESRTLNNDLLLNKAALISPHGGGQQFRQGDICYDAVATWKSIIAPADGSACNMTSYTSTGAICFAGANAALISTCGP